MKNMDFYDDVLIVIPARLESTRLPRKLLQAVHGQPLLLWTVKRIVETKLASVLVATDSKQIKDLCINNGYPVEMTSTECKNGTERVYEVAKRYREKYNYFLNVQADEPLLNIDILRCLLDTIGHNDASFKTAITEIKCSGQNDSSDVKVALDEGGRIRYASRAPIPYGRDENVIRQKIHGVYLYTYEVLEKFTKSKEGRLERIEQVEQLRCIENDIELIGIQAPYSPASIDIATDLDRLRRIPKNEFIANFN